MDGAISNIYIKFVEYNIAKSCSQHDTPLYYTIYPPVTTLDRAVCPNDLVVTQY